MSGLFGKIKDFVGLNDPADYEYEYEEVEGEEYQNLYEEESVEPEAIAAPMPSQMSTEEEARPARRRIRERVLSTDSGMVSMNNEIGMTGAMNGMSEVLVMEPRTFEEMPQAIQERKSVVLHLTIMDPDQAQRAVDFVAGGTYAMVGHQERIGESIFLFTPNCVQVSMPTEGEDGFTGQEPMTAPRQAAPTPAWATEQIARMA